MEPFSLEPFSWRALSWRRFSTPAPFSVLVPFHNTMPEHFDDDTNKTGFMKRLYEVKVIDFAIVLLSQVVFLSLQCSRQTPYSNFFVELNQAPFREAAGLAL